MAWSFDIRSALLVGALLTLLIGLVLLVVGRAFPPSYRPSLHWWVAATVLQPLGFVLLGLRDLVSPWLSIVLANLLVAGGFAAYSQSLRLFFGLRDRQGWLMSGVAAVVLVSIAWGILDDDLTLRLVLLSLVLGTMLAYPAWTLYRRSAARGPIRHVAGLTFAGAAGILYYRAGALLVAPELVSNVFQLTHVQLLSFAVGSVLPVVSTVGFLLLCTQRSQVELERAARVDFLTGAYNRRAIEDMATRAMAASRRHGMPLSLVVVDIDHFKRINDELGHAAGDEALQQVVARIRAQLRSEDLLGRVGGEEFIVLMPNTDGASAVAGAERIRADFSRKPLALDGEPRPVTLSIGVAVLAPADRRFSRLLQRADRAMYAAKNAGRDLVMADTAAGWEAGADQDAG